MQNHRYKLFAQVGLVAAAGMYYSTVPVDSLSLNIYQVRDNPEIRNHTAHFGVKCKRLEQSPKALACYQRALTLTREMDDKRGMGNNLTKIGRVYNHLGQYPKALDSYQQALAIYREIGDKAGESDNLSHLGSVYMILGQYQSALEYFQPALVMKRKRDDKSGAASDLGNLGNVYHNLKQYPQALEYYQQALALSREMGETDRESIILGNIGILYRALGQYADAFDYFQQALAVGPTVGNESLVTHDWSKVDNETADSSEVDNETAAWSEIDNNASDSGEVDNELPDLNDTSEVYKNMAKFYYQVPSSTSQPDEDGRREEGIALINRGRVHGKFGNYRQAKAILTDSLEALSYGEKWIAQRGLAFTEIQLNNFDAAITHYEHALDNIERLRAGLTEKSQKLSFMQNKLEVYDEFITLLITLDEKYPETGYDRQALEIFERKQGRIFLEEMGQSGARLFAGLPQEISKREHKLENQLAKIRQKLIEGLKADSQLTPHEIRRLRHHLEELESEQQALQTRLKQEYPDYYALKHPQPATLKELQTQVLLASERMLVYGVMKESTVLWVIGPKTFLMFQLPLGEAAFEQKVSQLRMLMGTGEKERGARLIRRKKRKNRPYQFAQVSYDLYRQLLPEPVRPLLTEPYTVYVVPTGPLYALPFETLVTQVPPDAKETHYLIEDVPIAYLSSASLLKTLREAQQRRQDTAPYPFLTFANPDYEAEPNSEVSKTSALLALRSESYRAIQGSDFVPLPETEDEAKEIATLFNVPKDSEALQLGKVASRSTVFQLNDQKRLDDYQYVLFATHGILPGEVDQVTQAALVLSHPDTLGYLTMADVFGLQFNAKLVSLSACNTGSGKKARGEGVMGLTRAFMYAGTPAIAVTLWSVESYSAKTLSVGFFKHLKELQKPAAALRAIKLRLLRGDEGNKYKLPYYWAPFVVFGDAK